MHNNNSNNHNNNNKLIIIKMIIIMLKIRFAFHTCIGGCDGCINFAHPFNKGLVDFVYEYDAIFREIYGKRSRSKINITRVILKFRDQDQILRPIKWYGSHNKIYSFSHLYTGRTDWTTSLASWTSRFTRPTPPSTSPSRSTTWTAQVQVCIGFKSWGELYAKG